MFWLQINKNDYSISKIDSIIKKPIDIKDLGPKKRRSKYRQHVRGIDEGKKILCFFSPEQS